MSSTSSLGKSDIGTKVSTSSILNDHKRILEDLDKTSYKKEEIDSFIETVHEWYPVYEDFGRNKIYPESSVFWRILTYIPYLKNISGFDTFEKLGKDAARIDIDNLTKFLKEDIPKKIEDIGTKIIALQSSIENKRNSL